MVVREGVHGGAWGSGKYSERSGEVCWIVGPMRWVGGPLERLRGGRGGGKFVR